MEWKPGRDMYIGLGLGFGLVLVAALLLGMPLKTLVVFVLVFAAVEAIFLLVMKRFQNK